MSEQLHLPNVRPPRRHRDAQCPACDQPLSIAVCGRREPTLVQCCACGMWFGDLPDAVRRERERLAYRAGDDLL